MRLFQNSGVYPGYRRRLDSLARDCTTFSERKAAFLYDRYGACHFLEPVLNGDASAFFTNGDDDILQKMWARENGLPKSTPHDVILLSQIESHRTEVFYNLDPMRYGSAFVRRLPASVKATIAWRAAPSPGADFSAYDRVVCNFPSILASYQKQGWRASYFAPAHDPEMDEYAANDDRPIDIIFVGTFSRHHVRRTKLLETIAGLASQFSVVMHLEASRLSQLAESPIGVIGPLRRFRRTKEVLAVSRSAVFGRELYSTLSRAKLVVNGAIDMAGHDRGNMRCWEALGLRGTMVSDVGAYPEGMVADSTFIAYDSLQSVLAQIERLLREPSRGTHIANSGFDMIRARYSKHMQFSAFRRMVSEIC